MTKFAHPVISFAVSLAALAFVSTGAYAADVQNSGGSLAKHLDFAASEKQFEVKKVVSGHKSIVERLKPGDELHSALKRIALQHKLKAGVVVSGVGSLSEASLRLAGASDSTHLKGPLEIVSITGTLSEDGMHVHLSASDSTGKTTGGHLTAGCKVFTTIELVILDLSDEWIFERKVDAQSTYLELNPQRVHSEK